MTANALSAVALVDNTVGDDELAAVAKVIQSRWLSAGQVTREFEVALADALGAAETVAVSSGTAALHLAFLALGIGPGDEVILPSLSFVAAAATTVLCGARPVFADVVSPENLTVDPLDVARRVTDRTRAVVAMHYGGHPAEMADLVDLARRHGLFLVEDAAHAPAVATPAGSLGTIGDIGCFSFQATKNLTTGEGGAVVASDPAVCEHIRSLRSHAMTTTAWDRAHGRAADYDIVGFGLNYRPTDISSAIGLVQLAKLGRDRIVRAGLVTRYRRLLEESASIGVPFTGTPSPSAHHLMVVLLPPGVDRSEVRSEMAAAGVQTSVHYPPTHLCSAYRTRFGTGPGDLPVTEAVAGRALTLPLHARMDEQDVAVVVGALTAAVDRASS